MPLERPRDVPLDVQAPGTRGPGGGGGPGFTLPPPPGGGAPSGPRGEDPDYVPPVTARDFFIQTLPTVVVAGPGTVVSLGQFELPGQSVGVIRDLSFGVINPALTTNITFHVLDNDARMEGWGLIQFPPQIAAVGFLSYAPESTFIRFQAGSLIDLQVTVIDGGAYQIYAQAHGWFYPSQLRLSR